MACSAAGRLAAKAAPTEFQVNSAASAYLSSASSYVFESIRHAAAVRLPTPSAAPTDNIRNTAANISVRP